MRAPIDILVELLDQRGVRVEVEEYLRLHAALQRGEDWTAQRLQHVIVGILATSPAMARTIREAVGAALRELETQTETGAPPEPERARTKGPRGGGLRLVVAVGVVVVALAVAAVIVLPLLLRSSGGDDEDGTSDASATGEPGEDRYDESDEDADEDDEDDDGDDDGDSGLDEALEPTGEADDQECDGAEQLERELAAQRAFESEYDARREAADAAAAEPEGPRTRGVSVPQYVYVTPAGLRLPLLLGLGALGLGALGLLVFFGARARSRREPPDLEAAALGPTQPVASGPSLFWLQPSEPPRSRALLLAHAERDAITWGLGHFSSGAARSRLLDADATVRASIDNGGFPSLRYAARRSLRRVWVWHDATVEGQVIRRLINELEGLAHSHGLELELAHFWGTPDQLEDRHGQSLRLDELEEERDESIVCVLTDGRALLERWEWRAADGRDRRPELRALLRRMASWHRLAFFHHGAARQRRALDELLSDHGLRCFALGELARFVEREGERRDNMAEGADHPGPIWRWAACCALYPLPVSELDALALRAALELPVSAYGVTSLRARSITTAGIQFAPEERARLITRLTKSDGSTAPSDTPPTLLREALAFWRARTVAGAPDWATDATGRGIHRRLVVAQLDLWTDPERALQEFARLRASPHFDATRDELARARPRVEGDAPPVTGPMIELPFSAARLQPGDRARLHSLGMRALPAGDLVKATGVRVRPPVLARPWLAVSSIFSLALGLAALLSPPATRQLDDIAFPERSAFRVHEGRLELLAGGEWSALTYDDASALGEELVALERDGSHAKSLECVVELGELGELRRCGTTPRERELEEFGRSRAVAVLDASREDRAARQFADRLLDDDVVDAVWIGAWPAWLREPDESALTEALGAASPSAPVAEYFQNKGLSHAQLWVFSDDPEFLLAAARRAETEDLLDTPAALSALEEVSRTRPTRPGVTSMSTLISDCAPLDVWAERDGAALVLHGQLRGPASRSFWSPSGAQVATVGYADGAARLHSATTGELLATLAGDEIDRAVYTPDGSRLITASADGTARVWDAATGEAIGQPAGHERSINALEVSPDGARFATGSDDSTARVWSVETGSPISAPLPHPLPVTLLRFSPDGETLLTRSEHMPHEQDGLTRLWSKQGEPIGSPLAAGDNIVSAAFSDDGALLLTGAEMAGARLWEVATAKPVADPLEQGSTIGWVAFVPNSERFIISDGEEVMVRSRGNLSLVETVVEQDGGLRELAVSPDGQTFVTAWGDQTTRLTNTDPSEPNPAAFEHEGEVSSIAFSSDSARFVLTMGGEQGATVQVHSSETGEALATIRAPMGETLRNARFSPDGTRVLAESDRGKTRIWTLASPDAEAAPEPTRDAAETPLSRLYSAFGGAVETIEWVPSTRWDALATRVEPGVTTRSLDARAVSERNDEPEFIGKTGGEQQQIIHGLTPPVHALFVPADDVDTRWSLVTADASGRVDRWSSSRDAPQPIAQADGAITSVAFTLTPTEPGNLLARTGYDGRVHLHALAPDAEVTTIETGEIIDALELFVDPDPPYEDELLLSFASAEALLQAPREEAARQRFEGVVTIDPRAVLRREGSLLIFDRGGEDQHLLKRPGTVDRAWVSGSTPNALVSGRDPDSAMTGLTQSTTETTRPYAPHAAAVTAAAFESPLLVTGSRDRTARVRSIWHPECTPVILRHRAAVTDVAIAPYWKMIATASEDGMVTLWSPVEEGTPTATRQALHSAAARTVAFDREGEHLVSTGDDGSVVVQEIRSASLQLHSPEAWGLYCGEGWDEDDAHEEAIDDERRAGRR